jgi:hypothetical protein
MRLPGHGGDCFSGIAYIAAIPELYEGIQRAYMPSVQEAELGGDVFKLITNSMYGKHARRWRWYWRMVKLMRFGSKYSGVLVAAGVTLQVAYDIFMLAYFL